MEFETAMLRVKTYRDTHVSHLAIDLKLAMAIALSSMEYVEIVRAKSKGLDPPPFPGETYGHLTTQAERLKRGEELLALGKQVLERGRELLSKETSSP